MATPGIVNMRHPNQDHAAPIAVPQVRISSQPNGVIHPPGTPVTPALPTQASPLRNASPAVNGKFRLQCSRAQAVVSETMNSTRSGTSTNIKSGDPKVSQPVTMTEDEFGHVMAVFEKLIHEKTEFPHRLCAAWALRAIKLLITAYRHSRESFATDHVRIVFGYIVDTGSKLATAADLANRVLQREAVKREHVMQTKAIWAKSFTFVDLKRNFPSLDSKEDEELF
ncbi:hypothetical protein NM688_g5734 [Phlebia brevispora]|uniref:Uncharacterized protein n=1 Tax=Phlebia brevispora TaxID=194682 RepID=A0ACC1SQN1_9APHY|nr:hypothetical protein NM688_g5734 [Phlebia brevispora]